MYTLKFWLAVLILSVLVLAASFSLGLRCLFGGDFCFLFDVVRILDHVAILTIHSAIVGMIYVIIIRTIRFLERKTSRKLSLLIGFFVGSLLFIVAGFSQDYVGFYTLTEFTIVATMVAIGIIMIMRVKLGD